MYQTRRRSTPAQLDRRLFFHIGVPEFRGNKIEKESRRIGLQAQLFAHSPRILETLVRFYSLITQSSNKSSKRVLLLSVQITGAKDDTP